MTAIKNILFVALFALTVISCSNDSSSGDSTPLEGKWQYSQTGTIIDNEEVLTAYEHTPDCTKDYIEILSTNVLKSHEFGSDCDENLKTGTWNRNNNAVVIAYPGEPSLNGQILELTATKLKVKFVSEDIIDVEVLTRIP